MLLPILRSLYFFHVCMHDHTCARAHTHTHTHKHTHTHTHHTQGLSDEHPLLSAEDMVVLKAYMEERKREKGEL
jgi:hypothetical protein